MRCSYPGLSNGLDIAKNLGISQGDLEYISRCLLDEIRICGCLSRELLRYYPQHSSCPSYTKAAEWERRMKQPQRLCFFLRTTCPLSR